MKRALYHSFILLLAMPFVGCDFVREVEQRAMMSNDLEDQVLAMKIQAVEREKEITHLKGQIQALENQSKRLHVQLQSAQSRGREIASVRTMVPMGDEDLVKFETYRWSAEQMMATAQAEFKQKNFKKSAQFFRAITFHYPDHELAKRDEYHFHAGVAAFEAGGYQDWTLEHLNHLISEHPTSRYYRGAKLWVGLTQLQMGEQDKFFATVEEFRKNYRNTPEWNILSAHYEKIVQNYKN